MDTRLIFLDIDGTFIEPGRTEAPASAAEAVRAARANGHKVFLCTGRNYRMTSPLLRYGFDGYVCSAGGYVVCGQEVLFDCPMDRAQSDGVRALLEAHGVDCTLEAKNATYGGARMLERFAGYQARQAAPLNSELERWRRAFADGMLIRPLEEYKGEPIYKICYIASEAASLLPAKAAYGDQFNFCETETFKPDGPGCINGELINRKFNKGEGIRPDHRGGGGLRRQRKRPRNDRRGRHQLLHGKRRAGPQGPLHPHLPRRRPGRHRRILPGAGADLNKKRYKKARPNVRSGFLSSSVFYLSRFHSTAPSAKKQVPMA